MLDEAELTIVTLLFLHIPKTAGTSLRKAIESVVPASERIYVYDPSHMAIAVTPERLAAMSDEQKRSARLVMGHFQYGIHDLLPQQTRYVTMLREPVDRLISMHAFYRREFQSLVGDLSLEDWATNGKSRQADNEMVRRIAGQLAAPIGECTPAMLRTAIENIERDFAAVLLTEELNRSYGTLGRLFGAELPPPGRENVAPRRVEIDDRVRERLADLNSLDVALYEYVKAHSSLTVGSS